MDELADEPEYGAVTWTSDYDVDPTTLALSDKVTVLEDWSRRVLAHGAVEHVTAMVLAVVEDKHFADLTESACDDALSRGHIFEELGRRAEELDPVRQRNLR